ncbi:glycosyltransferase family 4 protein [Parvularcula flava]|uniref:Glycosyltransferase family 4 protein n=1 Tax=Aquisalinus luteolus TaxID=1566827 RepID=A0A8J3A6V2_9PROT|nr:glycosyltransferase family 4 protein [Aquisalinus luteolus]NHK29518.1 glycosyltransferase family 4 protein [Aquisalinus luteolus]GGI01697.1 peptidase M14 [Aquisalinus luteolus]
MQIINQTIYQENPYHSLLYRALGGRYSARRGTVDDAILSLQRKQGNLLHIHWEEHPLRKCSTGAEAAVVADYLIARLSYFRKLGGRIIWTVHNIEPHEGEFRDQFLRYRKALAGLADHVHVHNLAAIEVLASQTDIDRSRIVYIPHPSYIGAYEDTEQTVQPHAQPDEKKALFFGMLRRYKGLDLLFRAVPEPQKLEPGLQIAIHGKTVPGDPFAEELQTYSAIEGYDIHAERVEDPDVPGLMRSARCIVIPYEKFLTSGVALLGLTYGVPVVAPNISQMRELFPPTCQRLLFEPGDATSLAEKIREAVTLTSDEFDEINELNRKRAWYLRPERISTILGTFYDKMKG